MTDIVDRLNASLSVGYSELRKEAATTITRLRAKIKQMEQQKPVAKVRLHQTGGNAGIAWSAQPLNGFDSLPPLRDGDLLCALPGAQNVPKEAIAKILAEVMDIAVSNGANSLSMPDEYVEVAAWLCGIHAQPAQRQQSDAKGE